ncbi:MAG: quinone-dependent dihydroorotate dehydrogenase [Methylococcales bacterium]|nr:quinone-dependent dihydroorotate dehydrogenase [Methylococcales bacterium]
MNLYALVRPLLFKLDPELAHTLTLTGLDWLHFLKGTKILFPTVNTPPTTIMGLSFKNTVGLAAGLDKNGAHIDSLAALGFGFIEIGTVTPRPQPGNPKPRLFRLVEHEAIINRMGFNNLGVDRLIENVKKAQFDGIIGINIGKNADTPIESAADDYLICLKKVYPYASYITVNISSPNTQNLRQLQQGDEIRQLLAALSKEQHALNLKHKKHVPLVLKIAPDLSTEEIDHIAALLLEFNLDGVIATNTTLSRTAVAGHPAAHEAGGLSGGPVREPATTVIKRLNQQLDGKIPVIAAGGILTAADAQEKQVAGAALVQLYSGLIYRGPKLINDILKARTTP